MTKSNAYPATLIWNEGEREALLAAPFAHPDFSFYIPADKLADYRARASTIPREEWKSLLDEEGFSGIVAMAYGPKDLVLTYCDDQQRKYPDQYMSVGVALARFGDEALPLVLAQADRVAMWPSYAEQRLQELGPVDAAEIALPIARLLSEKLKVRRAAEVWLVRHPEATLAGLARALATPSEAAPVAAAFAVLAKAGHAAAIRQRIEASPSVLKCTTLLKTIAGADRGGGKKTATKKATAKTAVAAKTRSKGERR